MKRIFVLLVALISILTGCNQGASVSPEDISKLAYKWEKARFDRDYDTQQKLLYEKGSYEVDKDAEKKDSGLKYDDMRLEIYYNKELEQYTVFTDFKNPQGENTVNDELVFRKKNDKWLLDQNQKVDRDEIKKEFEREECINCK